jgi:hypothetical protein
MTFRAAIVLVGAFAWAGLAAAQDSRDKLNAPGEGFDENGVDQCYCHTPIPPGCDVPKSFPPCRAFSADVTAPIHLSQGTAPLQGTPAQQGTPVLQGSRPVSPTASGPSGAQTQPASAPQSVSLGGSAPQPQGRSPAAGTPVIIGLPTSGATSGNLQGGLEDFSQPNFAPLNSDQKSFVERMKAQSNPPPAPAPQPPSSDDNSQ